MGRSGMLKSDIVSNTYFMESDEYTFHKGRGF